MDKGQQLRAFTAPEEDQNSVPASINLVAHNLMSSSTGTDTFFWLPRVHVCTHVHAIAHTHT